MAFGDASDQVYGEISSHAFGVSVIILDFASRGTGLAFIMIMDSNQNRRWQTSTSLTFWGATIQTSFIFIGVLIILYLAYNLVDIAISGILPSVASMGLDYYEEQMVPILVMVVICWFIAFLGYLIYLVGICLFKGPQRSINSEVKTRNIIILELIMPVLLILYFVVEYSCYETILNSVVSAVMYHLLPWLGFLAAVIYLLFQFKSLSKEESWSEKARQGADDVRFSYSCILWIQVIAILGIGVIALTCYSYWIKFENLRTASYSSYGMNDVFGGISSLSEMIKGFTGTIKFELLVIFLIVFIFSILWVIYRLMGWRKIQKGCNEEVYVHAARTVAQSTLSGVSRFCHKCGMELPEGSSFCPGCGTPVVVAVASESSAEKTDEANIDDEEGNKLEDSVEDHNAEKLSSEIPIGYEDEGNGNRKKWLLWGGVAAGIIAIVVGICGFRSSERDYCVVFADSSELYRSVDDETGIDPLAELSYGTPVECSKKDSDNGRWAKVSVKEDGKTLHGFVDVSTLISNEDFEKIDNAGLGDYSIRASVSSTKYRHAILHALGFKDKWWSLDKIDNGNGSSELNGKPLLVRGVSPSERCFAFVLSNDSANWNRELYVYSFTDHGNPEYLYSERLQESDGKLRDVSYKNGKFVTIYTKIDPNSWLVQPVDEIFEIPLKEVEAEVSTSEASNQMKGYIDGKYEIVMEFHEEPDNTLSGVYCYTKYNVPIAINGSFEIGYNGKKLVKLHESQNDEVIGHFEGVYDGYVFSGWWHSADGESEMPFRVEKR